VFTHSGLRNTVPTNPLRQTQKGPYQKLTQRSVNKEPTQHQRSENKSATAPTNPGIQNPRSTARNEEPREPQTQPKTPSLRVEDIEDICSEIEIGEKQTPISRETATGIADITEINADDQTVLASHSAQTPMAEQDMGQDTGKPTSVEQYKVRLCRLDFDLTNYSPDGPEEDLKDMLECEFGPIQKIHMERCSTSQGECLLGTAEVAFATQKAAQKCIKASNEKWLILHGKHLHAKMT